MTDQPADLRHAIAKAIHHYDNRHALSGNDMPSAHHYGEADAVLAVLAAAGVRDTASQANGQQPPAVAYGDGKGRAYCLGCASTAGATVPLTVNVVDHWEECPSCGRHVVDVARQQPAAGVRDAAGQASGQQPDAECPQCSDTGACNGGPCAHPAATHCCSNCDGIDPATCLMNPDRPAVGVQDATQPTTDETVVLPPTTQLSYRIEHRREGESTWRQGRPGTGLRWTYAEREKADQRLAEAREQWPQYEHRMVVVTTTMTEAVAAGAES
ncbi:hypothetical protein [Streptomyces sp. NPDC046371]|uniref:hypothetical protein n=1 Tax=Streptomyces sp. NPDC046371 TaxID=3154916 RepID=UPI00340509E3